MNLTKLWPGVQIRLINSIWLTSERFYKKQLKITNSIWKKKRKLLTVLQSLKNGSFRRLQNLRRCVGLNCTTSTSKIMHSFKVLLKVKRTVSFY